jgi:hypothetical protein
MPLVKPVLIAGSSASILVPARAPEGAQIGVEARVVTGDGEPVATTEVSWHRPLLAGVDGTRWIPGTLSTEGLEAGDYRLEITTREATGLGSETRTTDFTIKN